MEEVTNLTYGFSDSEDQAANRSKGTADSCRWLRTYSASGASNEYLVRGDGSLDTMFVGQSGGICPTFNIELSDILLSSVAGMDKSMEVQKNSVPVQDVCTVERTLTLKDRRKNIELTGKNNCAYIDTIGNIWVPYRYTDTSDSNETVNQISVMITDKEYTDDAAKILYYGALQDIDDITKPEGMGRFAFPDGVDLNNSHVYLIAEHVSGQYETDYASQPVEIMDLKQRTDLQSIQTPDAITGIANGTDLEQIKPLFPSNVTIKTTNTTVNTAPVRWNFDTFAEGSYDPNVKTKQTFKVKGTVMLPDDVFADNISLEVVISVTVNAQETPKPTPVKPDPKPAEPSPVTPDPTPVKPSTNVKVSSQEIKRNSAKLNQQTSVSFKNKKITITWNGLQKVNGYDIFAEPCGTKITKKSLVKSVKSTKKTASIVKIAGKKLSTNKSYKVRIKAYRLINGKKVYIGNSQSLHVAGKSNKRYTNVKKTTVPKKSVVLKIGKQSRIKATLQKESKKKKLLPKSHGKTLRYYTTNSKVATVTSNGTIKAKKKGNCSIYIVALNGVKTKVKVTVKE